MKDDIQWESVKPVLRDLYEATNIPIYVFDNNNRLIYLSGEYTQKIAMESPFLSDPEFTRYLATNKEPLALMTDAVSHSIYHGVLLLDSFAACMIGPLSVFPVPSEEKHLYMHSHNINPSGSFKITQASLRRVCAYMNLIANALHLEKVSPYISNDLLLHAETPVSNVENASLIYALNNTENEIPHHTYKEEQRLLEMMKNGDETLLGMLPEIMDNLSSGTMSYLPQKQMEYSAVITISLTARAAIQGGVDAYKAYDLNDLYLQRISTAADSSEYHGLMTEALKVFYKQIKAAQKDRTESVHIKQAQLFIRRHLNKNFTLAELADHVGLTPTYLSGLFSAAAGMTIKEFTLQERINAAKNMLKYSDYSIEQIAFYLCFCSQSYFTTIFKKYTGTTPGEYRNANFWD